MSLVVPVGYATVLHSLVLTGDVVPYAITYAIDTDAADGTELLAVATALHGLYNTHIGAINPNILTLTETVVEANLSAGDPPTVASMTFPQPGAGTSTNLVPQNTALLVHKRTTHGGRTGRGRMYFPAVNEANVDSIGQITGAWQTTVNTALANWLIAITATTHVGTMQLLHNDPGAGATLSPFPVTSLGCDPLVATQRRRLRK